MKKLVFFCLIGLLIALSSCSPTPTPTLAPTQTATGTPVPTSTSAPTATLTPTDLPPLLVLLSPPEADAALSSQLQAHFSPIAQQAGFRWQVRPSMSADEVRNDVDYMIALPPAPGLADLVAAAPNTRFLAVGVTGLESAPNLIAYGTEGQSPDQQGFMAGYIAATITENWRVGVISVEDTEEGIAARQAFRTGVLYFCGLCRTSVPPFYEYPLFIGLPARSSNEEWRFMADFMRDRQVETVFVVPGAGDEDLLRYLAELGINIIATTPSPEGIEANWVLSIRPEIGQVYFDAWPELFGGEPGYIKPLPVLFTDINSDLMSPGKQTHARQIFDEVLAGFISTTGP